ncbi:TIR domain-containing protein [uncultured Caulobacter sp.]|uniref:TIR domain-containing protein n=1 Tax=uncultured Caulobacter sp. TaxID=158749 RepID=UPI002616494A|nr:TIR domain-containing protein [uncultured Caulobacter sp.]
MLERYQGPEARRLRVEAALESKLAKGDQILAEAIADQAVLQGFSPGETLIQQGAHDNQVYILIAGACDVIVNGKTVNRRAAGDHVGEMAAIQPAQGRSATVRATETVVAFRLEEPLFAALAGKHPEIYRAIAKELARRLLQRNAVTGVPRQKPRVFIISSVEALKVARAVQSAFEYDDFNVIVWTDGVFKVANYTLQSLEDEIDKSDFAVAIAHPDDTVRSRKSLWPKPRDNVIFELGLFMGRLGRARAILMEPREEKVQLPSDLAGVTTIPYRFDPQAPAASMGPACNRLREHILELGLAVG